MNSKELKTPAQVARELNISIKKVREYLRQGIIQGVKIGRYWGVSVEELQRHIQKESVDKERTDWKKLMLEKLMYEKDDLTKQMEINAAIDREMNAAAWGKRRNN